MRKNIIFNKTLLVIISTYFFIVISFNSSFANQQDNFNPNLPPKITDANAEFVYKFLLAEIASNETVKLISADASELFTILRNSSFAKLYFF